MHRLYRWSIAALAAIVFAGSAALADGMNVSEIDGLRTDVTDGGALLLSWTEQSEGPFMYTVTLCNNDTLACQLAGATAATSFILDTLDADTSYDIHVGAAQGNTAGLTVTTPEAKTGGDDAAPSTRYGSATESVVSGVSVNPIGGGAFVVSWTEETEGFFRYSISLSEADAAQPVLQGTTTGRSFVLEGLAPGAEYDVQIGTAEETTVSYTFTAIINESSGRPQ